MLRFIKHHVDTIIGIEIYPLISFGIFFLFFVAVSVLVFTSRKEHIDHMSSLPFDEGKDSNTDQAS